MKYFGFGRGADLGYRWSSFPLEIKKIEKQTCIYFSFFLTAHCLSQ